MTSLRAAALLARANEQAGRQQADAIRSTAPHVHVWSQVRREFTPPRLDLAEIETDRSEALVMIAYGFTTVEMKCRTCADTKFVATPGRLA